MKRRNFIKSMFALPIGMQQAAVAKPVTQMPTILGHYHIDPKAAKDLYKGSLNAKKHVSYANIDSFRADKKAMLFGKHYGRGGIRFG
jgi:hypothetical protein